MIRKKNLPNIFPSRNEDFKLMDSLMFVATDLHNLRLKSFNQPIDSDEWFVEYLDLSKEKEPLLEESRDEQDYQFRIHNWIRHITVKSPRYAKFEQMIKGEIERLNK